MMMEDWEGRLEAERLALSAPEVVYDYLSKLGPPELKWVPKLPALVVERLMRRNEPLIDLGLARFTTNNILGPLWEKGEVVRLAMASNRAMIHIPASVEWKELLETSSRDFVHAMMTNPTIHPALLADLISNEPNLNTDNWWNVCASAILNPRLRHTLKSESFDEQVEAWQHEKPIGAVWDLFLTAPVTPAWCSALSNVGQIPFELVLPKRFYPDMQTEEGRAEWSSTHGRRNAAYRELFWKAVQEKWVGKEGVGNEDRFGNCLWVRRAFAEAYVRSNVPHDERMKMAVNTDPAFRFGYYAAATVYSDWPIDEYIERDRMDFVDAVTMNDSLYLRTNCDLQRRIKAKVRSQEQSHDDLIARMRGRLKRLVEKDPALYGDTPTEEMLDEFRRQDEEAARRERLMQAMPVEKPAKNKGWFG